MKKIMKFVKGLDAVADAFSGTVYSDVISMKEHKTIVFLVHKGVGATGTSTITIQACDDVTPSNTSAVPFRYQEITSGDTAGAITDATTAGFTTTAGSSQLYAIYVDASDLASSGYGYVRLKAVEVANDPVLGGIIAILDDAKYEQEVQNTAIV